MASSDSPASLHPWLIRPSFPAGFSPSVSSLYDTLNAVVSNPDTPRGGQQSITISGSGSRSNPETASKGSGLRNEAPGPGPGPVSRRVKKRKSRASKKSPITFIAADQANFRQMVQQVTGVKFPEAPEIHSMATPILKPHPHRIGSAFTSVPIQGCLPTLDTSEFFLDHQQLAVGHGGGVGTQPLPLVGGSSCGGVVGGGSGELDFDSFSCFPTVAPWKVI